MKTLRNLVLASVLANIAAGNFVQAGTVLVSDTYNVTGSGSGFALGSGANSGINPPTTRLTGTIASGLRYINTGTKATTAYTIASNKLKVTSATNPGRFVLSSNGTSAFDFGPSLGIPTATPGLPVVYDLSISMDNDSTGTQRFSFAIGTIEGDATTWDFGFQVYRASASDNFYTIGKRVESSSSGLVSDLNSPILTMGANTYGTEITVLMRITDAGSELTAFNSRVQLSLNGGSTWFYDSATDSDLVNGFRFNGSPRIIMWDVAPDAGNVTYDNFSLTWNSGQRAWTGAGANGNWSNSTNWAGVVPSTGIPLVFNGTTRQVNTNDLAGLNIPWVTFNNGGFSLYGNTWTNSGAITNVSGNNTLKGGLAWSSTAAKSWSIASGSELILDNVNSVEVGGDHTISGGGNLRLKSTMTIGSVTTANPAFIVNEGKHIVDGGTFSSRGGYRIGSLATGAGAQTILTNGANMTFTVAAGNLRVGDSANPVTSQLLINNSTLTMAGGILCIPFAAGATSVVNQTGGLVTGCTLSFSDSGVGTGSYTVKDGTLEPLEIRENNAAGNSSIFFDNAILRPAAGASSAFMSGLNLAQIQSGGLTIDTPSSITIAQVLSGTGALTKTGSSALTLSGNNSFSGGATLTAGTLTLGHDAALGSGTITLNGGTLTGSATRTLNNAVVIGGNFAVSGTQAINLTGAVSLGSSTRVITTTSSGTTTLSGVVSGSGGLTKDGTGILQFSGTGANTYSGTTLVNAGTLSLAKTAGVNALPGNVTIGDGTGADSLQLNAANQIADSATVTVSAGGTLDLNGFSETVASVSSSSASGQIALGTGTLTFGDAGASTFAGSISGSGNLVKQGSGSVTLTGTSSFSGSATVTAGVLNIQNSAALGASGTAVVNNGAALEIQGGISVAGQALTLNGGGISSGGALRNISGNNSWGGSVALGSAVRISSDSGTLTISGGVNGAQNLTVGGASDTTISGVIANGSLTKDGNGTLTLSGANSYVGNTVISVGTLALGASGSIASSPNITIANGATFNVSAVSGYAVAGSQTLVRNASSGTGTVNGSMTFNSGAQVSLQADGSAGTVGVLSVAGGLILNGNTVRINVSGAALAPGTYPLVTYTGTKTGSFSSTPIITGSGVVSGNVTELVETVGQISLRVYSTGRTWSGSGADNNWSTAANWDGVAPVAGDKLTFSGTTRLLNTNDIVGLTVPSITFNAGGFTLYGNALTVTNAITNNTGNNVLNAGLTLGNSLTLQSVSNTFTVGSVISGTGSLTKDGTGVVQFSGGSANTYSGATVVNAGTLALAKSAGVNAIAGNVTIGDGTGGAGADVLRLDAANQVADSSAVTVSASGRFDLNGFAETVASISGASSAGQIVLGSGTLTIGDANSSTFAGVVSGSGNVVKQGAGTLTLTGANTYSGNTTISAGTLALGTGGSLASANISLASNVTYNVSAISGYTLGASQTLSRNSAGGAGNITGSVTFASGAKASPMVDGTSGVVGTLNITGNITLNANVVTVNVTGGPLGVGTYTLITYSGTKSGSFNATPTITGSGLGMGLAAKIVETTGVVSIKVYVPAHGISAASIKVVEKDLANSAESVDVSATVSINGLQVRDGSSRGDYAVQVGSTGTDDLATGVMITSVAENGKDHGEDSGTNFCTSSISFTSSGYFIPTSSAPDGKEYNINVSAAFLPYAKYLGGYARNSAGTAGGPNDLLTASPGLVLGTHFVDNGGGLSTVNLTSLGINSQNDGVLMVTAGANNNEYAASKANADGTWTVYVADNGTNGAATTQGPVAFAFIPKTNVSVISGKFQGDGTILMYNDTSPRFSVTNTATGTWKLTIPGYSSSRGVLVISAEGGNNLNVDNIVSAQPSGNDWLIQSRDLPGLGLQALTEPVASFVFIPAPTAALVSPANGAANIASAPALKVTANGPTGANLTVTFFGHRAAIPGPGPDFLLPVLPDTQNYARESSGSGAATKEMWFAQTDWIVSHRDSDNIPFVATLGDCVNNADVLSQWRNATNAMYRLEDQATTKLLEGIPYGITVGNHDQDPNGDPDGSTALYNQFFGTSHFSSKSYYGDNYSTNNDSWYDFFSAGGMDFLVFSFEYGRYGTAILDWANNVIAANPTRRVIVLTHHAGDDTPDDTTVAPFSAQGSAIYNALKSNPNFFLMLGGHVFNEGGEGRRSDTFNGKTVRTLISDYQGRFNGGNGLMRLMYFSPSNNLVSVKTFSPYTGNYETDANSQFSFTYNMQPNGAGSAATAYAALKTNINVVAGTQSSNVWSGLQASKPYEWYVTVTDEVGDYSTSPEWTFSTTAGFTRPAPIDANNDGIPDDWEAQYGITNSNADNDGDGQSNLAEYLAHTNPTNAASVLKVISATSQADGTFTLTWSSVGGTRYRVQYADDATGDFNDIERDIDSETDPNSEGVESTQSFTDPDALSNGVRFYRVKVVP